MECPRCQHQNRPQAKLCEECAGPLKGARRVTQSRADDLKAQLDTLKQALTTALEQPPPRRHPAHDPELAAPSCSGVPRDPGTTSRAVHKRVRANLPTFLSIPRSVLLALSTLVGWPLAVAIWRRAPRGEARVLLGAWTVLFLLPQGGAPTGDRLLFVPVIGAAGLLAMAWSAEPARWGELSRFRRTGAWVLELSVTVGSGLYLLILNGKVLPGMASHVREKVRATDVRPRTGTRRDVLVLQTESQLQALTLSWTWHAEFDDESVHFALMQSGRRGLRWTRTDERTFELEALRSCFLDTPLEGMFLTNTALKVGTRWRTPDFEVETLTVDEDCLRRLRVTLDRSLDDPSLRFVRPVDGVLSRIEPPAVGTTLELPAVESTSLAP